MSSIVKAFTLAFLALLFAPLVHAQKAGTLVCDYPFFTQVPAYAFGLDVDQSSKVQDATFYLDSHYAPGLILYGGIAADQCSIGNGATQVTFYNVLFHDVSVDVVGPTTQYVIAIATFSKMELDGYALSAKSPVSADALAHAIAAIKARPLPEGLGAK